MLKTALDGTAQAMIGAKLVVYGDPLNPVQVLFKCRIVSFCVKSFNQSAIDPTDIQQLQHAADVIPSIISVADTARHIFDLNVQVHRDRYNRIIQAAVEAL